MGGDHHSSLPVPLGTDRDLCGPRANGRRSLPPRLSGRGHPTSTTRGVRTLLRSLPRQTAPAPPDRKMTFGVLTGPENVSGTIGDEYNLHPPITGVITSTASTIHCPLLLTLLSQ